MSGLHSAINQALYQGYDFSKCNDEERRRWAIERASYLEGVKDAWSLVSAAQDIEAYLKGTSE